jgi:subtilase family serine protease
LFYSSSDLHINQIALDSAGLTFVGINTDIDGNVRQSKPDIGADEFAYTPNDIGASLLVAPKTGCGLPTNTPVVLQITNYGGLPQSGFNVSYAMNGGTLITENVGGLTVQPGGKSNYTFTATVNVSTPGVYNFRAFTQSGSDAHPENDTLITSINSYPILTVAPANMVPANNTKDIGSPIDFSWSPTPDALYYDIYVWLDSLSRPSTPTISGITGINYKYYNSNLLFGATYKWQVIARNSCSDTASVVQRFTILNLSDLLVSSINVPPTAFSGQDLSFSWTVKNSASGGTGSQQWSDQVFLSADTTFSPTLDKVLGTIGNFSALNAGQSYVRPATFTLPNGITGNYYLFVKTDTYNYLKETNENNNMSLSAPIAISLTPPPDVRVSAIVTPQDAFSGQGMSFSYTVKNEGAGDIDANDWYDRVFLSSDTILSAVDPKIGEYHHIGKLKADSSYTQSKSVDLPDGISGPYYLFVQTDVFNQVYEYVFEGNNTRRSDSINVILSPPVDYVVTSVVGRASVSNKDTLTVSWTVENQGGSTPKTFSWSDEIYLSTNGNGDLNGALLLASTTQYTKLSPFTSYTAKQKVNVPDNINGPYFIYVVTDATNKIFEHTLENNNTGRSDTSMLVVSPDLIVSSVSAPASDSSGKASLVKWTVKNNGAGKLVSGSWRDYIYISSSTSFNGSAVKIDSLEYGVKLNAGDTIAKQKTVKIPNGISGTYYLYVYADGNNKIFEHTVENNNITRSAADNIILSPWSDLETSLIQVEDTMNAGDATSIKFTVSNKGLAKTDVASWKDKVYISKDATWSINAILIGTAAHGGILSPDSAYIANVNIVLPPSLLKGNYYVYVMTDSENKVYEHTAENNNRMRSSIIYINAYPPVDLSVTNAVYRGVPASGKPLSVDWTVKNNGQGATTAPAWNDAIYLSLDSIWDKQSDIFVAAYSKDGPLNGGASYQVKKSVTLPNGVSGLYYLLVVTDQQFKNPDVDLNNNDRIAQDSVLSGAKPINIMLTAPADLVVSAFTAPVVVTSGQPFRVDWTITNQGTGNTIKTNWVERVYLSTDNAASNDDTYLGAYVRNGSLAPSAAYSDTLRVNVPASASGNYFLIMKTDYNDVVYEYLNENNNTKSLAVNVVRPPASDLIVSSITAPPIAVAGQSANISWKTKNNSVSAVSGTMKEAVYFSADSLWDLNDVLLGTFDATINLLPQAENTRSVTADIPGLALGDYHILVQTDILNNIFESNDTNNTSASSKITVDVLNLPINVLTPNTLTDNRNLYYKIEVPDSLQGESMLIALKADSVNANNEMFVKFGSMPDKVVYDYTQDNPFQGNQELIIPNLKTGTYYLMVNGATSVDTTQSITLLARILNFEIRSVDANKGGNTGFITVLIRGSKFENNMKLRLEKGAQSIQADSIIFVDPTKIYARFNLQGAALGKYDVVAESSKQQLAVLDDGFEVVVGIAPELLTNILHPSSTRISSYEILTIQFTNAGNTDLVNPVLILHSVGGAPVGFKQADLALLKTDLTIPLQELNGPAGVLRPGAIGSVIIYTKAVSTLGFLVEIPNFD